jgi:hypothetical protein
MREPMVSSGVLAADASAGSGTKVRGLSEEELRMARAAEESVQRVLQMKQQSQLPLDERPWTRNSGSSNANRTPSTVTNTASMSNNGKISNTSPSIPTTPSVSRPAVSTAVDKTFGNNKVIVPSLRPSTSSASNVEPTTTSSSISTMTTQKKRKLEKEELEIIGKALQLTVKHRLIIFR